MATVPRVVRNCVIHPRGVLLVAAAAGLSAAVPARAELTHRFNFNDGTANDSVGAAHGVLVNGPQVTGGQLVLGNDGVNNNPASGRYVDLPNGIAQTSALTLETWVTFQGGNLWQEIATLGTGSLGELEPGPVTRGYQGTDYVALIPLASTSKVWGTIRNGPNTADEQPTVSSSPLPVGSEHHLAYAVDYPAGTATLYMDGQQVGQRGTAATQLSPTTPANGSGTTSGPRR
jgi:hypothetical protein